MLRRVGLSVKPGPKLPAHVYHLAEAANWPAIQRHGLLSASALLDRAGLPGKARAVLEREQRMEHTVLPDGTEIRDQRPLPSNALSRCLVGLEPAEWYAQINRHVFFWLDPARLNRQRRACGSRPQIVLVIDTAKLVAACGDRTAVTPINTGNARRQPARRGAATFVPYREWLKSGWETESISLQTSLRSDSHAPVELAIADAVPEVARMVVRTQPLAANEFLSLDSC